MMSVSSLFKTAVAVAAVFVDPAGAADSNGWNDNIDWVSFDEAKPLAESSGKPIMTVIHKSWCGACKQLKPNFAGSKEIEELSSQFVMVNLLDDAEPDDKAYAPDGGYIPRIIFSDSSGTVRPEITTAPNPKYKYFYSNPNDIVKVMQSAVSTLNHNEL